MCAGAVSTAGGLVLSADDDGDLVGLGAKTGKSFSHFYMGRNLKASQMTLDAGGKQYITRQTVHHYDCRQKSLHVGLVE